jgi:hypothetical protein
VIVKPCDSAVIKRLIPRLVGNEGLNDVAEGPNGQRREGYAHSDMRNRVTATATSFGMCNCRRLCRGQTMAMMKIASDSGANTLAA